MKRKIFLDMAPMSTTQLDSWQAIVIISASRTVTISSVVTVARKFSVPSSLVSLLVFYFFNFLLNFFCVPFHTTMIALNILKSAIGFAPILFSMLRTTSFISPPGDSYQDIRRRGTLSFSSHLFVQDTTLGGIHRDHTIWSKIWQEVQNVSQ